MGKGEVAAELLGRLEDIDSLRVAALLIRETGRVGGAVVKWTAEKLGWVMVKELHTAGGRGGGTGPGYGESWSSPSVDLRKK